MASVVELFLDPAAYLEVQIGRDGHVACIEQAVDVPPKQEPVSCLMFAAIAIRANMCRLQGGERPLLGDSAPSLIQVRHEHPKRALPESRPNELRLPEPCLWFGHAGEVRLVQPIVHRVPKRE